jgi:hypothetical protein
MSDLMIGISTLVVVLLLVVILGLEMQISANTHRIEEMLKKVIGDRKV